ncbi:MAG: M23 family metallopeptidase [Vallitaleaceae bacterium]|jgi:murein DD-endopeptidase MepM/ murein hydrolase activator NlpD|nr:M23 family metallopeptidase [Vallitaleaceae bacterium]
MELGILRNRKIHKKKCSNYITFMVIPDPTKKAMVIKLPKWMRFPLLITLIVIVLGAFYIVDYTAKLEYQTVADRYTNQINGYAIEDRDVEIDTLQVSNVDNYDKLQELEALQLELESNLADIQAYKEELNSIVNRTEKTTNEQPSEALVIQEASPIISFGEEAGTQEMTYVTTEVYESSIEYDIANFNVEYETLKNNLNNSLSTLVIEETDLEVLDEELDVMVDFWDAYPSGMPVNNSYVVSEFGLRLHPIARVYRFHDGVDLKARYTSVYATGKGTVIGASYESGYGNTVDIDHGYGYVTRYAHLSKITVSEGDEVVRGQQIAVSGNSGSSTGPHLHYEVFIDGQETDPEPFLN